MLIVCCHLAQFYQVACYHFRDLCIYFNEHDMQVSAIEGHWRTLNRPM